MSRTMKASMLRLAVLALSLVMLLGMLPAGVFAAEAETATTGIKPVADTYVSYANHTTNYGAAETLLVDGSVEDEKIAFLSYESWPFTGVEDATLNLPMSVSTAGNVSVYLIDDYLIDEDKLNWANMPSLKSAKKLATAAADGALTVDLSGETFEGAYFTIVVRADQENRIYEENFNDVPLQSYTAKSSGKVIGMLYRGEEKQDEIDNQIYSEKLLGLATNNNAPDTGRIAAITHTYDAETKTENPALGRSLKNNMEVALYNSLKDSPLVSDDINRSFKVYYRAYTDVEGTGKVAVYVCSASGANGWVLSPVTTVGQWTTLSSAITLTEARVSAQQGMISIFYTKSLTYLDDIFVVETTSGKTWNTVSASFDSKEGTSPATVSFVGVSGATAFRPVSETYVSPEAPDTALGATALTELEIGGGKVALVTFDISKYRDCESLELVLPVSGEVKVSLMDYQMNAATLTYNTYKALTVAKTDMGIIESNDKIDLTDFIDTMMGDYLTVVIESVDYYEQDFEAITSLAVASASPKCIANEDGTITDWGANLVYSDESDGVYYYKYGGAGNSSCIALATEGENQYVKLIGHTGSATYGAEIKVHNLLGLRQMTAADVGKTYRITFDMKSNQTTTALSVSVKTPDNIYEADGTTTLHGRTVNMLTPMPTFTAETADTWKTYTFDVTLTADMVKWQGVVDFVFNIPNRDGTLSNYFAIDNLKSTLVDGSVKLSAYNDGASLVCASILHEHAYDKKVMNEDTFVAEGENDTATYYYSCACGAVGTETFTGSHVHTPGAAATATTPQLCTLCGALIAPPTDSTITARYKIGDATEWTYASFAAAMTAANSKTATIELIADDAISANIAITGGTISISSIKHATEIDKAFVLSRAASFTDNSLITVSGGAKVTIQNVVFDGKGILVTKSASDGGGIFKISGTGTTVTATNTKLLNSNLKNTIKSYGGAVYVASGAVFTLENGEIRNCTSQRGPAVFAHTSNATFNMVGGLIEGCYNTGSTGHGAAVALYGTGIFNMNGGLIINNTTTRTDFPSSYYADRAGIYIDGAVGISGNSNKVTLSGNAIIRNNTAKKVPDSGSGSTSAVYDAGIIGFQTGAFASANMIVNSDFTGSVAYGHYVYVDDDVKIATPSGTWAESETIINGFIDNHYASVTDQRAIRVGKLVDGKLVWVKAQAEVDVDGKITRYATYADAYAAVGNKAPIKLLADAQIGTDILEATGDTVKIITNGYKVTFIDDIECGVPTTATETVGAFTAYGYTYEGYDAQVTTYTATYAPHEHRFGAEATDTTAQMCEVRYCGVIKAYPTDETLNTRYSTDNGLTWTFTTFADAMSQVDGETAIVEFFRDVTVTAGTAITSGNMIIRSVPADKNLVETDKIVTLTRDASFTDAPMFTVSGGANVTFDDVVLDGAEIALSDVNGTLIRVASASGFNTVVNISDGVTLMNADAGNAGLGGALYVSGGSTVNMTGGLIKNCFAKNGAAIYLISEFADQFATFNMSGGLITECVATNNATSNFGQASAIMLYKRAAVNMSGGMIAGNKSLRNNSQEKTGTVNGSIVDGAVNFMRDNENHLTLSGNAIIRNNGGYRNVDETLVWDEDSANVTFFRDYFADATNCVTVKNDFTGSVGIAWPGSVESTEEKTVVVGNYSGYTTADEDKIVNGIFDDNCDSRVAIVRDGKLYWANATAQLDVDGKINRYVTLDEAYAIVGNTEPITLLGNATVTFNALGDTVKVFENGYVLRALFNGSFEKTSTEKMTLGAFTFEGIEFPGVEVDVATYTAVDGGSIANVSGLVGTDLSLRFYACFGDDYADSFLRVTRNGETVELRDPTFNETLGQYCFTYTGIAPQCLGDVVTAELVHGDEVLDTISNYSLLSYIKTLLGMGSEALGLTDEKTEELKTLLRDLLAYGAAAQKYTGYNTDALVNEGYTASEFIPMGTTTRKITVNNKVDGYSFKSAGLRFANVNNLYFKFMTPDVENTKLVVNGETKTEFTQSGTTYVYFTEDLYATDFDKLFTVELYAGETLVQTLTYSVSAYVHSMIGHADDTVKELAMATYNYGLAARVYTGRLTEESYTVPSMQSAAIVLGGATVDGTALNVDKPAAGIEFAFRGAGNITLNVTAEADARFEITVDGNYKIEHYLVSAGTADYEIPLELKDGKHTVRIVQETGSFVLNSVKYKGYPSTIDAKNLYIEFVGDELLAGRYMYLNPTVAIDDASAAYAFLAASELDAQYLISSTSKYLTAAVANTNVPALVVIDYQEGSGIDYATIVANVKATYGDEVNILFAAGAMNTPDAATLAALGESVILTTDNSGYEAYPSKGASALNGAELAKYIRENYDFFTAEQVSSASKDMILAVDDASNGYNTFHVYVKTSDPSDNVYVRYNFIYEYNDTRTSFNANTTTNISNFRVKTADLVEVTEITETAVTATTLKQVLQTGEISMAIKTVNAEGVTAADFTGGYHGDERLTYVKLVADGKEIDIQDGTACVLTCNSVLFDQHAMAYEHGTSTADSYGTDLTTHNQHFVITRESGVNNRQSLEWQKDIQIVPASMYLQMFTLNRYVSAGSYDVCDIVETYNADGVRFGKKYESGPRDSAYSILSSTTNRATKYGATTSGISAYTTYDSCNVGTFADNKLINNSYSISVRTQGDNKLYVNFKSSEGNNWVAEGEKWIIDVAYGIDYVDPNN